MVSACQDFQRMWHQYGASLAASTGPYRDGMCTPMLRSKDGPPLDRILLEAQGGLHCGNGSPGSMFGFEFSTAH